MEWSLPIEAALIVLHLYLCVRFAVLMAFKYSDRYKPILLFMVCFLPFLGYYMAMRKLG